MLRIKDARERCNWSQEQLANAIGTTQQSVQRYESGATEPKVSKLVEIANATGTTLSFLIGFEEQPKEQPISASEAEMLAIMREISPLGIEQLMIYARGIAATYPKSDSTSRSA